MSSELTKRLRKVYRDIDIPMSVRLLASEAADEIDNAAWGLDTIKNAIDAAGCDIGPCAGCDKPVVTVPDGMSPWCMKCHAENMEEAWTGERPATGKQGPYTTKPPRGK